MASKLRPVAKVQSLEDVKRFLFSPRDVSDESKRSRQDYSYVERPWEDLNDSADKRAAANTTEVARAAWLQECIISVSPTCDLLVFARQNRAVFLQTRGSSDLNGVYNFCIVYSGILENAIKHMRKGVSNRSSDALRPAIQPQTGDYQDDDETISALLCIPIASQKRSNFSLGTPDWTAVVVGFSTGFVQFYTENGTLLSWQLFTERPARVVSIRLRSYSQLRAQFELEAQDELTILLTVGNANERVGLHLTGQSPGDVGNLLVVINGPALLSTLNTARSALARHVAAGDQLREVSVPQLGRKFALEQSVDRSAPFTDHIVCGTHKPCMFERLRASSFASGFRHTVAADRASQTHSSSHVLVCGTRPSFAVYSINDACMPPLLDLTVQAVSKLRQSVTSSLGGLFGFRRPTASPSPSLPDAERAAATIDLARKRAQADLAATAAFQLAFSDDRRACVSAALSANARLAALVDRLGRALLIDTRTGCVVRMLKGARDGRCGWLQVTNGGNAAHMHRSSNASDWQPRDGDSRLSLASSMHSSCTSLSSVCARAPESEQRKVHCVVLYAPRRKVLELFLAANGPRVAAFSVSASGTLLYAEHTLLGLNATLAPFYAETVPQPYFLDEHGSLFAFDVPFAVAADTQSSGRFVELQTLKRITLLCEAFADALSKHAADTSAGCESRGALVRCDADGSLSVRVEQMEQVEYLQAESVIAQLLGEIRAPDILLDALRQLVAVPHLSGALLERLLNSVCANPKWNPHCNRLFSSTLGGEAQSLNTSDIDTEADFEFDAEDDTMHHQKSAECGRASQRRSEQQWTGLDDTLLRFCRHHLHLCTMYQFFANLPHNAALAQPPQQQLDHGQHPNYCPVDSALDASLQSLVNLEATVDKLVITSESSGSQSASLQPRPVCNSFMLTDLFNRFPFDGSQKRWTDPDDSYSAELQRSAPVDNLEVEPKLSAFLFAAYFDQLTVEDAQRITDEHLSHALDIPLSRMQVLQALITFWLTQRDRFAPSDCLKLAALLAKLVQFDTDTLLVAEHDCAPEQNEEWNKQVAAYVQTVLRECSGAPRLVSACSFVQIFRAVCTAPTNRHQLAQQHMHALAILHARLHVLIDFKQLLLHNVVNGFGTAMQLAPDSRIGANELGFLRSISVSGVLRAGKGAFTELFCKSLAAFWNLLPANQYLLSQFSYFFAPNASACYDERLKLFQRLVGLFPHSLERNNVLLNVSWELLAKWMRNCEQTQLVTCAIDLLTILDTPALIGGTLFHCNAQELIWRVHFARTIADLTGLVEKHGHIPSERVLRKTVVLDEDALCAILVALLRFFDIYVENVRAFEQPREGTRLDAVVVDVFTHDATFFEKLELLDVTDAAGCSHAQLDVDASPHNCENEHVNLSLLELLQELEIVDLRLVETRRELVHCLLIVAQLRCRMRPSALFRSAFLELVLAQPKVRVALQRSASRTSANANSNRLLAHSQSPDDIEFEYDLSAADCDVKPTAAAEFDWRSEKKATLAQADAPISAEMQKQRHFFLENSVVLSAKLIADEYAAGTQDCASSSDDQLALTPALMQLDGVRRAELIFNTARLFQCDVDLLKRLYVTELYAFGLDRIAFAMRNSIDDKRALLSALIPVAATRLALQLVADVTWSARSNDDPVVIDALRYRFNMRSSLDYYLHSFASNYISANQGAYWKGARLPTLQSNCELLEFLVSGCGEDLQAVEPKLLEIYEIVIDVVRRK